MTAGEHVQNLENKRAALTARMADIMNTAADAGATTDAAQADEHDGLAAQVKIDRWRSRALARSRKAADHDGRRRCRPRRAVARLRTSRCRPNVEPGIKMARFVIARIAVALRRHRRRRPMPKNAGTTRTPEVALALKAAVAAGTTTDATWAKPLVNPAITSDFLPLLRAATIIGKIAGLRKVPFNVNVPGANRRRQVAWVGELKPKPVTAMAFAMENLGVQQSRGDRRAVAGAGALQQSVGRSGRARFAGEGHRGVSRCAVHQPGRRGRRGRQSGVDHERRAHGGGDDEPARRHLGLINHFATNNIPVDGLTFILSPSNALALSFRTNLDGSPEFPGIGINGGTLQGAAVHHVEHRRRRTSSRWRRNTSSMPTTAA